ncbi:hypothetical protein Q31b_39170 [Novipirellula aureliae]|uniref:Uncharacterized protein n=1 Tax=Novipirellula aureliae TaxID=2527966 RepID=A0A5C6DVL5_9BACT|nr:hypothetical protein Q31b_39170 [Novipirellula aureliae]
MCANTATRLHSEAQGRASAPWVADASGNDEPQRGSTIRVLLRVVKPRWGFSCSLGPATQGAPGRRPWALESNAVGVNVCDTATFNGFIVFKPECRWRKRVQIPQRGYIPKPRVAQAHPGSPMPPATMNPNGVRQFVCC